MLTRTHIARILQFNEFLLDYNNANLRNTDCPKTSTGRCIYIANIAEYFQDANGVVTFPTYNSDADLVAKLNEGKNAALNIEIRVG